ncbi:MAG: transposase [Bdellovibrionota bacterium]
MTLTTKKRSRKITIGTIALFSNKDLPPEDIYTMYKMRTTIEQTFDTLKTTLKADAQFMSDDDKFQGWMFINHIAL